MENEDWEHRRTGEGTNKYLARVLETYLGLPLLAEKARRGDFSELTLEEAPMAMLIQTLNKATARLRKAVLVYNRINKIIVAIRQGEFDGTEEEYKANRWMYAGGGNYVDDTSGERTA